MRRREFAGRLALGLGGSLVVNPSALVASGNEEGPALDHVLSETGSSRATAYPESNKVVTCGDKTHVAWLDSVPEGFRVQVRTLDRSSREWSPVYPVGAAHDNHGGPALTLDSKGYLHVVYAPHHHPFRYRRSVRPNDASEWGEEIRFGERCTYPTMLCGRDDTLYLTCRESRDGPWVVNLYVKPPGGEWEKVRTILRGEAPGGYAHFQVALVWGRNRRTIHLSTRIYDGNPGRGHTVGYLRSPDLGDTWERADGTRIELPGTPETITNIENLRGHENARLRCGSLAVDSKGTPYVLFSSTEGGVAGAWLARLSSGGDWERTPILEAIFENWPGWGLTTPCGLVIGEDDRIFGVLTMVDMRKAEVSGLWGHPTSEVLGIESSDGGNTIETVLLSEVNPTEPHWLPNIEKPTGWNRIGIPGVIYTAGTRGKDNQEIVSNRVHWAG